MSVSPSSCRTFRLREFGGDGDGTSSSTADGDGAGLLRIGEGVRELEDASEGDGVIEPSEPLIENDSGSEPSSGSTAALREDRVLTVGVEACGSARRGGILGWDGVATRCLGASGGLLSVASGWNSIIGRSRCSQLYCWHREIPRSRGIQVPSGEFSLSFQKRITATTCLDICHNPPELSRANPSELRVPVYGFSAACQNQQL